MPQDRSDLAVPNPSVVLFRLFTAATIIGLLAIALLLAIAFLLTGFTSDDVRLLPWNAFKRVPLAAAAFVLVWATHTVIQFLPIHRALSCPPEELEKDLPRANRAFRRLHSFPYTTAWTSFGLWALGGAIGAIFILTDFILSYRIVCGSSLPLLAIAINLPQLYIYKGILAPSIAYLRRAVPSLAEQEAPFRHPISQKLRVGFAATLLFALGLSLIANYLQLEWLRLRDRVDALKNLRQILVRELVYAQARDVTLEDRDAFYRILSDFPVGKDGSVVLLDAATGNVLVNPKKLVTDDVFRLAVTDGLKKFGEDYRRGITIITLETRAVPELSSLFGAYEIVLAEPHTQELGFLERALVIYLLMLVASSAVAYVISQDLVRPLRAVLWRTRRVTEGKLNTEIPVLSDDEVGDLAGQTRNMVRSLHRIMGSMRGAFENLSGAASEIATTTSETSRASNDQLSETLTTGRSIESLNSKIEAIVRQVSELQESVDAASSAGFELASTASQLRETVRHLDTEMVQIAGSTRSLDHSLSVITKGIGNLRVSASDSRAALGHIDTAISEVGAVAKDSEVLSADTLEQSRQGTRWVAATREGIQRIEGAVTEAAGIIRSLADKNRKVEQILDVVNSVADQTNLLSFNAAIIAAQAGEHGQGFAVVADEIRKLADQTAASVGEIAGIVSSVHRESARAIAAIARGSEEVARGQKVAIDAEAALAKITRSAEESLSLASKITATLAEESSSSAVVVDLVDRLQSSVEEFGRTEEEQRRAAESIVRALGAIQQLTRKVSLAAEEQKRASDEVSRGISDVQGTMESVLERVRQEGVEAAQIEEASGRIRKLADANAKKARHLEAVSGRLQEQAARLRSEMSLFEL